MTDSYNITATSDIAIQVSIIRPFAEQDGRGEQVGFVRPNCLILMPVQTHNDRKILRNSSLKQVLKKFERATPFTAVDEDKIFELGMKVEHKWNLPHRAFIPSQRLEGLLGDLELY